MKWLNYFKYLFKGRTLNILHNNIDQLYLSDFMEAMEITHTWYRPTLVLSGTPAREEYIRSWRNVLYDWSIKAKPIFDSFKKASEVSDNPDIKHVCLDINAFELTGYLPASWFDLLVRVCQRTFPGSIDHETTVAEFIEVFLQSLVLDTRPDHQ